MSAIRLNNDEFLERLRIEPRWRLQLNRDTSRLDLTIYRGGRNTVYESENVLEMYAEQRRMFMEEINFIAQNGHVMEVESDDAA